MARVLVLDGLSEQGVEVFRERGIDVDVKPPQSEGELAAILGDYDGLVVRSATKVTAAALENAGRLKVIGRAGVGRQYRQRTRPRAGRGGQNTPGGNTISCRRTCLRAAALFAGAS